MNTKNRLAIAALLAGLAVGAGAQAAEKDQHIYLGGKVGAMDADVNGFDPAITIGIYGGYNLLGKNASIAANLGGGWLAVEGEFNVTAIDGDAGAYGDWSVSTIGAYGAYFYPLTEGVTLKGKGGIVRQDFDVDSSGSGADDTNTGLAIGFGAGFRMGPGSLDVELTLMEDMNFLSVGYNWRF
jgi:hypothetical protein